MIDIAERRRVSYLIGGSLLLLVGALFALQNLGIVHAGRPGDYWPLLLVWVGLTRMLGPGRSRHFASGVVIVVLGLFFQLDRLGVVWIRARDFWPIILVVAGIALIADSIIGRRRPRGPGSVSPFEDPAGRS